MPPEGSPWSPPSHSPVNSGELSLNFHSERDIPFSSSGDFLFASDLPGLRTFVWWGKLNVLHP